MFYGNPERNSTDMVDFEKTVSDRIYRINRINKKRFMIHGAGLEGQCLKCLKLKKRCKVHDGGERSLLGCLG
jgi:hypothetical protein